MKYLSHYTEAAQTAVFEKLGVFFAFNQQQLAEGLERIKSAGILLEGEKVGSLDSGIYCPRKNVDQFIAEIDTIHEQGVAADIAENGIKAIIHRELGNHEAQITGDLDDTIDALNGYGISDKEIQKEYRSFYDNCVVNDWF